MQYLAAVLLILVNNLVGKACLSKLWGIRSGCKELVISLQTVVECFSLGSCLCLGHITGQLCHLWSQHHYTLRVMSGGRDPPWWKGFPGGCHSDISSCFMLLNQKGRRKILTRDLTQRVQEQLLELAMLSVAWETSHPLCFVPSTCFYLN